MLDEPRVSTSSSSELPYARPVIGNDIHSTSTKPAMYVLGTDPATEEHLGYPSNGHSIIYNASRDSLAESTSSQAVEKNDNSPYRSKSRHRRKEYSNSQEGLNNGHVNFSKPVRPSDSSKVSLPALEVSVPASPSVSTTAIVHGTTTASHSPATPINPAASASATNEEHITPDALLVQQTYARIDEIGGIPGDGFVEGVELTRERRTQSSINGYLEPLLAASWGPSSSLDRLSEGVNTTSRRKSEGAAASLLSVSDAMRGDAARSQLSRKVSAASRAASSKAPEEEEAELKLLEKVDRYGFFTPAHLNTTSGRLVLLAKEPCMDIPKKPITSKVKGKQKLQDLSTLTSPYITLPSGAGHPQGQSRNYSPRTSLQPPSSQNLSTSTSLSSLRSVTGGPLAQSANTKKEPMRILKWYDEMIVPSRRDTGGNVSSWKLSDSMVRDENKLQRRIRKGIPDRWRLAAWEALLLRMRSRSRQGPETERLERRFYVGSMQYMMHPRVY